MSSKDTSVTAAVSSLTASKLVLENAENLSEYGFDEPYLSFEAEFSNGNRYAYTLGALSPDGSYRYLIETGKNTVYAISQSTLSALDVSRYDFLEKTIIASYTDEEGNQATPTVELYQVTRPDMEAPLTLKAANNGALGTAGTTKTGSLEMTSPGNAMVGDDKLETPVYSLFGLPADSIVQSAPTEADLTKYGFDEPTSVLELQYNETFRATLRTGYGLDADGNVTDNASSIVSYYLMRDGVDMVFTVSKSAAPWMTVQTKDVISKLITLPYIGTVDKVEVEADGQVTVLDITNTVTGEGDTKTDNISFTLGGKEVAEENGKSFYTLLLATEAQDVYTGELPGKPVLRYTYDLIDGEDLTIEIYRDADLTTYLVLNGEDKFVGRSGSVEKIKKELENLKNGNSVNDDW